MSQMRAKMYIESVDMRQGSEVLTFRAVGKASSYGSDGLDEDNTYAKYSPSANLTIHVANPALFGQFKPGDKFYVDFTAADAPVVGTAPVAGESTPDDAPPNPAPTETVSSVDAPADTGAEHPELGSDAPQV